MPELLSNAGDATVSAADQPLAVADQPAAGVRRQDEARARRRPGAIRLNAANDDGFHLFRIY